MHCRCSLHYALDPPPDVATPILLLQIWFYIFLHLGLNGQILTSDSQIKNNTIINIVHSGERLVWGFFVLFSDLVYAITFFVVKSFVSGRLVKLSCLFIFLKWSSCVIYFSLACIKILHDKIFQEEANINVGLYSESSYSF